MSNRIIALERALASALEREAKALGRVIELEKLLAAYRKDNRKHQWCVMFPAADHRCDVCKRADALLPPSPAIMPYVYSEASDELQGI
jgi:hypothetical protein